MEVQELHRGRLIDHIQLVVSDLEKSRKFYEAVAAALGLKVESMEPSFFWVDELVISSKKSDAAQGHLTGRTHLAFQAKDKATVDSFYRMTIEAGGKDNGKPGDRNQYHPGYYAAFVLDPDGNNIEAVYHGPAKRSADSVHIQF